MRRADEQRLWFVFRNRDGEDSASHSNLLSRVFRNWTERIVHRPNLLFVLRRLELM